MYLFHPSVVLPAMRLPDMVAFSAGGFDVYWYGILMAVGILGALVIVKIEAKRLQLPSDLAVDLCLIAILCGIIGARIWYVFTFRSAYAADPLSMLYLWDGGLSVYGAALAALVGICIYARKKKIPLLRLSDAIVPGLAAAQAIISWGDFFNQTGYGPLISDPSKMWFPLAVLIEKTDTVHYAVFFYEFLLCALLFLLLWLWVRKSATRDGTATLTYVLLFTCGHALLDCLRSDIPYLFGKLSTSQAVCIPLFILAAVLLLVRRNKQAPATTTLSVEEINPTASDAHVEEISSVSERQADATAETEHASIEMSQQGGDEFNGSND